MTWIITKYLLTAGVVVVISEIARRSDKLGSFIAALPLIAILTLIWLYLDKVPQDKIGNYARYTFWYVIPTLPMFLVFPMLLPKIGFWLTLIASILLTIICFGLFTALVRQFGINLL